MIPSTAPIEGFWTTRTTGTGAHHYFIQDSEISLCGSWDLNELAGPRRDRKPGREDCCKCVDIYREIHAPRPIAEPPPPDWTVTTEGNLHTLLYQGKPQSTSRLSAGPLREMAAIYNRTAVTPAKTKARCAADHPDPAKHLAKKAHKHSPALPLPDSTTTPPTTTPTVKTMPAKAKPFTAQPVDSLMPQVEFIPASQFRRYPSNRLITPDQIAKMSDSIRQVGVLQPITARQVTNPETGGNDFEIVIGESRWLGCCDLDPEYPVPTFVRDLTEKEAAKIHTVENFQRKDLDEIEEARAIQHLKDTGWTIEEIIAFLGREKSHIYLRLTLLKLGENAHAAIRDGSLTLRTAEKLAAIPEDQREEALAAGTAPTTSAKSLPERQAIELLDRDFIQPLQLAKDWEKRRDAILENHPGAKWLPYDQARQLDHYNSGHVRTDLKPEYRLLSDAARSEELLVPTWGDLAKKHGAPITIGANYNDEAESYVERDPLIDAEKAACSANPEDCIFIHEAAVHLAREASEARKREREAHNAALQVETKRIAAVILTPDGLTKTATKKLVETSYLETMEHYQDLDDIAKALDIDIDAENGVEKTEAAILKFLRSKVLDPFQAAGRLHLATWIANSTPTCTAEILFESGAIKPADFPAYHAEYQERLADKAAVASAEKERAAAATAKQEGAAA